MYKEDVLKFFGTGMKAAAAAHVSSAAVSAWKEIIPERCAQRLAEATGGALVYDKTFYNQHHDRRYQNRKANRSRKQDTATQHKESD